MNTFITVLLLPLIYIFLFILPSYALEDERIDEYKKDSHLRLNEKKRITVTEDEKTGFLKNKKRKEDKSTDDLNLGEQITQHPYIANFCAMLDSINQYNKNLDNSQSLEQEPCGLYEPYISSFSELLENINESNFSEIIREINDHNKNIPFFDDTSLQELEEFPNDNNNKPQQEAVGKKKVTIHGYENCIKTLPDFDESLLSDSQKETLKRLSQDYKNFPYTDYREKLFKIVYWTMIGKRGSQIKDFPYGRAYISQQRKKASQLSYLTHEEVAQIRRPKFRVIPQPNTGSYETYVMNISQFNERLLNEDHKQLLIKLSQDTENWQDGSRGDAFKIVYYLLVGKDKTQLKILTSYSDHYIHDIYKRAVGGGYLSIEKTSLTDSHSSDSLTPSLGKDLEKFLKDSIPNYNSHLLSKSQIEQLERLYKEKKLVSKASGREKTLIICCLTMFGKTAEEIMSIMNYKNQKTIRTTRSDLRKNSYLTHYEVGQVGGYVLRKENNKEIFSEDIFSIIPPDIMETLQNDQINRLKEFCSSSFTSKLGSKHKFFKICFLTMAGKNSGEISVFLGGKNKTRINNMRGALHKAGYLLDPEMTIAKKRV